MSRPTPAAAPQRSGAGLPRTLWRTLALAAALAAGVFAGAVLGIEITRQAGRVAAIWIPNALVVVVLLRAHPRRWVLWLGAGFLGNAAANAAVGDTPRTIVLLALSNSFEIVLAAGLTRWFTRRHRTDLTRPVQLAIFFGVSGLVAAPLAAAVAMVTLHLGTGAAQAQIFREWVAADVLGLLALVPLLFEMSRPGAHAEFASGRRAEWIPVCALALVTPGAIFALHRLDLMFLLLPLLVATALRLRYAGVATVITLVLCGGLAGIAFGRGETAHAAHVRAQVEFLQLFLLVSAVTLLPLTAQLKLAREGIERFRDFFTKHHVPMWFIRAADGRILDANQAAVSFYGYPREALLAMHVWEINQLGRDAYLRNVGTALASGRAEWLMPHRLASGEVRQVSVATTPVTMGGDAVMVSTLTDVTDRVAAERAVRASEQLYAALFGTMSAGVVITDAAGRIVDANKASEEILGLTRSEHTARSFDAPEWQILRADGTPMPPEEFASVRALRERRPVANVEMGVARPDGTTRWITVSATPIPVEGYGVAIIHVDVTPLREARAELARLTERYQRIMEISQDAIHVLDREGKLVEANAAFLASLRLTQDAIGKVNVREWDVHIPGEMLPFRVHRLIESPELFETRHRRSDGSVFDVEVHAGGIELDGTRYLLASARDISARKELDRWQGKLLKELGHRVEEEVARNLATERLMIHQARLAAMGEMIGHIAHQWRQPLNGLSLVLANLADAQRLGGPAPDELAEATSEGQRLIQQMSRTITDFSEFFRPDKEPVRFSVRTQAAEAVALVAASFRHHGVAMVVEPGEDVTLLGFPHEYSQALLNLLTNARDAILDAGRADGEVRVHVTCEQGQCRLRVTDNGPGIAVEPLERIFEPYFSTKAQGTGLGLYMSQMILHRSIGGALEARNVEGGAEFTIIVPLPEASHDA